MKKLYAVRDKLAGIVIASSVMIEAHDAPAIRAFGEVVADARGMISRHPADFELISLATITDDGRLLISEPTPDPDRDTMYITAPTVIITGDAVKAMQTPAEDCKP